MPLTATVTIVNIVLPLLSHIQPHTTSILSLILSVTMKFFLLIFVKCLLMLDLFSFCVQPLFLSHVDLMKVLYLLLSCFNFCVPRFSIYFQSWNIAVIFVPHTGCEVAPDVNVAAQKFLIRLLIPAPEGMNEVYLRCENVSSHSDTHTLTHLTPASTPLQHLYLCLPISPCCYTPPPHLWPALLLPGFSAPQEQQYAQWMAACRLGSKGKTLADSTFQSEIQSIRSFLAMQKTNSGSHGNAPASDESINTHSLVSPRYHKKYKPKQVESRRR